MDGWGSLTMLLKGQNAEKIRKTKLRNELQKRKESFFKGKNELLELPEITKKELKKIKLEIRQKLKKERIKSLYVSSIIFIFSFIIIYLLINNWKLQ